MARWILLLLALIGFAILFTTKSAGLLGLGILFILVGSTGFVLALVNDRIAAGSRPDSAMASIEDLAALRKSPRPSSPPRPPSPPSGR